MNHLLASLQCAAKLAIAHENSPGDVGKTCVECGKFMPLTSFAVSDRRYRLNTCRQCMNDRLLLRRTGRTERLPRAKVIEPGDMFGRWTVVSLDRHDKNKRYWRCRCECGNENILSSANMHAGKTRSCGCIAAEIHRARSRVTAANKVFRIYKFHAARRQLSFELTIEEFAELVYQPCHYCGIDGGNCTTLKSGNVRYNGVDRLDNSQGYRRDNVVSCCGDCNLSKLTRAHDEFIAWARRIAERHA